MFFILNISKICVTYVEGASQQHTLSSLEQNPSDVEGRRSVTREAGLSAGRDSHSRVPGAGALGQRALAQPAPFSPRGTRGLPGVRPSVLTAPVAHLPVVHRRAPRETQGNRKLKWAAGRETRAQLAKVRWQQDNPSAPAGSAFGGAGESAQVRATKLRSVGGTMRKIANYSVSRGAGRGRIVA